eukprot:TRINITY_DN9232_c0_g1_i7.p1 TRINITY_DN9232_c0_g1~~TRINITY_DN9232_c0_g1_i7.p1  ORF type:complete len:319 (+),score=99.44 TRINITY_DN9232_c0_g1_i7:78-1034(+)
MVHASLCAALALLSQAAKPHGGGAPYAGALAKRGGAAVTAPPGTCSQRASFIHISKCGGTGMLATLDECCPDQLKNTEKDQLASKPPRDPRTFWFHSSALEQQAVVGRAAWDAAYTFALVRNPWDRQLSRFWFRVGKVCHGSEKMKKRDCALDALIYKDKDPSSLTAQHFQKWVRMLEAEYPVGSGPMEQMFGVNRRDFINLKTSHYGAAQWYWVSDEQGKLLVDDVYKLEELKDHWPKLQSKVCGLAKVSYAEHSMRGRGPCAGNTNKAGCTAEQLAAATTAPPRRRRQDFYDNETQDIIARHMHLDVVNLGYRFDD